jgi:PmbA protein
MISVDEARALAAQVVSLATAADAAEVLVQAESTALTRFANNRINQNVAEDNVTVSVRAVLGKRVGVAITNRLDDASLTATAEAAVQAASLAPEDPSFPGLPGPAPIPEVHRDSDATRTFDAQARANAVGEIVAQSSSRGLTAAGKVETVLHTVAVANSLGVDAGQALTTAAATVLSMGRESGSGWASFLDSDASMLSAETLGRNAADLAERSTNPGSLSAGTYTVVLAPEAVADILDFLAYTGVSAKAFSEGRSFLSGKLGQPIVTEMISVADDPLAGYSRGLVFDYEGQPKRRVQIIDRGIARAPVTDSYWAAKLRRPNTGHALPAPNPFGPMPSNLEMANGVMSMDQLIGTVKRGVYVTRFHYVNVEDPIAVTLTGMTRDGTFLIEHGRLTRPLKNLRFTQSAIAALAACQGVSAERRFVATEEGAVLAPGLLIGEFAFTGQTS